MAGGSAPCRQCPLDSSLKTKRVRSVELDRFQKTGRQYHVSSYPLKTELDKGQSVLHYRDVTEERELQHKLAHSGKMAAIGTLAGGVAHEINNPLGGILAFTQLVMKELGDTHPSYADLKEIESATLRCKGIVQNLLDFSRQNRDQKKVPLQLNDVINKVIPLVQVQSKSSGVTMVCSLAENLPLILGDSHKLQQVFLNLMTNAYHAMKEGGTLTLETTFIPKSHRVIAKIQDTGVGIKKENLDKIFDPYFTTKEHGQGTGLGLSISYGIIREHEATIEVYSQEGKGTTFTLAFNALEAKAA